ncbi:Rne/Rng family ribonuclease [Aurantimonas marina]|uniref:Rne/Rng family ribonuclease n=1 Tax=Aurantimonas marina TaxID=2780508 RepID=UPI0019CFA33D|nr:Rne/Rng family ribonuclease [Aurantimonas marina]
MANKMLIDASHQEETRVVVVRGSRIEEFDFESEHKKQLKGNIYLAKVTRVEPSLQAAFVEYGGNRHGFLAFSEIHPDYYQIPKADRQALIEEELARVQEEEDAADEPRPSRGRNRRGSRNKATERSDEESISEIVETEGRESASGDTGKPSEDRDQPDTEGAQAPQDESDDDSAAEAGIDASAETDDGEADGNDETTSGRSQRGRRSGRTRRGRGRSSSDDDVNDEANGDEAEQIDEIGSEDAMEEVPVRQSRPRRQYKIQEVIKRRQILLVQVVKEERGNKGAALTTYLSLAGRYSVLMPNTARGGGISRKITNASDRKRLKDVVRDLDVPKGMGIILRTAGANRTKPEVKRDYEYLMRLWETVRNLTLSSIAPALVYEEGSLIKRSIRDLYNKDIDQILVAGEAGYREAKDFMRMLMPSQAKVVQPYRDPTPIFARQGIESQLEKMVHPHVTLKSGGYIIINQTEALVAIDVNSGRSTREHSIEDTAFQTNLEAAEEVARQLRLRDLAGLIVIDFIDMEEKRNNRTVEKKIKDCLKSDRARIQVGSISHFGLLEMSRQRIRASVLESTMQPCPVCEGAGHIRSASSSALHVLRTIEEHLQKHSSHDLIVKVPTATALYVLNEKRQRIEELERHYGLRIVVAADESAGHQSIAIEHGGEAVKPEMSSDVVNPESVAAAEIDALDEVADEEAARKSPELIEETGEQTDSDSSDGGKRRRRRRRKRRGEGDDETVSTESDQSETETDSDADEETSGEDHSAGRSDDDSDRGRKRRRRGRRGGRRNRDDTGGADDGTEAGDDAPQEIQPVTARGSGDTVAVPHVEPAPAAALQPAVATDAAGEPDAASETPVATSGDDVGEAAGSVAPESAPAAESASHGTPEAGPGEMGDQETVSLAAAANDDVRETQGEEAGEPVVTSSGAAKETSDTAEKPRRTGWWARRSFF